MIPIDQLELLGLAAVVASGIAFMLWTLFHLVHESHIPAGSHTARPAVSGHPRR